MNSIFEKCRLLGCVLKLLAFVAPLSCGAMAPDAQDGAMLYQKYCAQYHDSNTPRIPTRASLQLLSRVQIVRTLESGVMKAQGAERTPQERAALAAYLSGPSNQFAKSDISAYTCKFVNPALDLNATQWNGWGHSLSNDRFQSSQESGLNAANVHQLRLRWAFGFPDVNGAAVQPVIIGRYV